VAGKGEVIELPFRGSARLADLAEHYDLVLEGLDPELTLDEVLRSRLGDRLEPGRGIVVPPFKLRVREVSEGRVESVWLVLPQTGGSGFEQDEPGT